LYISKQTALIGYHCGSGHSTNYAENNLYADGIHLEGKSSITFQLKGGHDAHILLQHDQNMGNNKKFMKGRVIILVHCTPPE
jgi:hypothetical protein